MSDLTQNEAREAQDGSEEAFVRLFERLYPALEAWAGLRLRGALGSNAEPDDVVQEVWYRALQKFSSFDPDRGSFRSWLMGIASNVVRETVRKPGGIRAAGSLRSSVAFDDVAPQLEAAFTSITTRARREESSNQLLSFALELPEDDRKLFIHRGLEGLPLKDVGMILGLSENAATKRWLKLRERLATLPMWQMIEEET